MHPSDETLSSLLDNQVPLPQATAARRHLGTCDVCRERMDGLVAVRELLTALPAIQPGRDFTIGPRIVGQAARILKLERWYAIARVAGGTLAAAFLVVFGITLSQLVPSGTDSRASALPAPVPAASSPERAAATSQPAAAPVAAPRPPSAAAQSPAVSAASGAQRSTPSNANPGDYAGGAVSAPPALPLQGDSSAPAGAAPEPEQRTALTQVSPLGEVPRQAPAGPVSVVGLQVATVVLALLTAAAVLTLIALRRRVRLAALHQFEEVP